MEEVVFNKAQELAEIANIVFIHMLPDCEGVCSEEYLRQWVINKVWNMDNSEKQFWLNAINKANGE